MTNPYLELAEEVSPPANPYEGQTQQIADLETYESTMQPLIMDKKFPIGQLLAKSRELGRTINPKQEAQFRDQVKGLRTGKYSGRLQFQHQDGQTTKDVAPDDLPIQSAVTADETSAGGSFLRGLNTISGDLADDVGFGIKAGKKALSAGLEDGVGNFLSYQNREKMKSVFDAQQAIDHGWLARQHEADETFHNTAQTAGQISGIAGSVAIPFGQAKNFMQTRKLADLAKVSLTGAVEGGAATIGGSEHGTKLENAPIGVAGGALIAPVAAPLIKLTGALSKRIAEVTGIAGTYRKVTPEIAAYANRIGELTKKEIADMREKVQAFRRAGVDPRLTDVVPRREQDRIRAMARKDTPGREVAYETAETDRRNLPGNLMGQFDRATNTGAHKLGSADEIGGRIRERRDYDATRAMNTMRGKPVEFDATIGDILGTRDGQRAWSEAIRSERDPAVRQSMEALPGVIRSVASMNPAARAQVFKQTGNFTIGMADRLRRKLNDAGQAAQNLGKRDLAANMFQAAKDVASAARRSAPDYDKYLKDYAEDSTSIGAIKLGGEAFDKNTDDFVKAAVKLGRDQNAIHGVEAAGKKGLKGKIDSLTENTSYGSNSAKLRYTTADGKTLTVSMNIPGEGQGKVASLSIAREGFEYGDDEAYNTIGPDEMRDLAMYAGQKWPWLESVTGHRVGGARQLAREQRTAERNARFDASERDAGVTTQFDEAEEVALERNLGRGGGPSERIGGGIGGLSPQATADEILEETGPEQIIDRDVVFNYLREYDDTLNRDDPAVTAFVNDVAARVVIGRGTPSPTAPPRQSSFGRVSDDDVDLPYVDDFGNPTADETFRVNRNENYIPPVGSRAVDEIDDGIGRSSDEDLGDFVEDPMATPPAGSIDPRTPGGEDLSPEQIDQGVQSLYDEYREVADSYAGQGDGDFPDFEQWLGENFYDSDLNIRLGRSRHAPVGDIDRSITALMGRILRDEAGSKAAPRLPTGGMFRPDVPRAPPTQSGLPSNAPPRLDRAVTGPQGSGIPDGPSTRHRIDKMSASKLSDQAQVPTHPTELDAPSDQMLAILQMRRTMEAKMGETPAGPNQMGNAMATSPEQNARNTAIMGEPVAAELQRGMAATMLQRGNSMRMSPAAGSSTAMNVADDANLGNVAGIAMDAAMGNKVGIAKRALDALSQLGMRDIDVQNIVTRAMDDSQTDQLIDELERAIPDPTQARKIIEAIREAGSRAVGMAVSEAYPAEEE